MNYDVIPSGRRVPSEEFSFDDVTRSPSNEKVASKTDLRSSQENMADSQGQGHKGQSLKVKR